MFPRAYMPFKKTLPVIRFPARVLILNGIANGTALPDVFTSGGRESGLAVSDTNEKRTLCGFRAGLAEAGYGRPIGGMAKNNPFTFLQQTRQEVAKVTWPTRRETAVTTVMVFIMVAIASVFFLLADQLMAEGVKLLLGLGF